MSRTLEITMPSEHVQKMIPKIRKVEGLISLRIHKDVSIHPAGDFISLDVINSEVNTVLELLEQEGLLRHKDISITTHRPTNIISKSHSDKILSETHESSWEDMLKNLLHESNMSLNTMLTMFFSGCIAALGIAGNSIHIVIGAMLIAPGFEPISRVMLGLISNHRDWKNGVRDVFKGYGALIIGGILGTIIFQFLGKDAIPGSSSYLPSSSLVNYWSTISATSLIVSVFASTAGGIIIVTNKSLLTAGVMVALALVPAATLIAMGIVEQDFQLVGKSLFRLALEISIVAIFTGAIFFWKKSTTNKRNMRT